MSVNYYYIEKPPCSCCNREYPRVHIGKSSMGWVFGFQAIDERDTWERMKERIKSAWRIENEYGQVFTADDMIDLIKHKREGKSMVSEYPSRNRWASDGFDFYYGEFS